MMDGEALLASLGRSSGFDHFYGHDPDLHGLETVGQEGSPAHLLLTLDLRDPLASRLGLTRHARFRFIHPYRYENRNAAYRQTDGGDVVFLAKLKYSGPNWPYADYPRQFSRVPVGLKLGKRFVEPSTAYRMSDYPDHPELAIYLGKDQATLQEHVVDCPVCRGPTRLLARVPDQATGALEPTWGTSDVFAMFWYCDSCGVTVTHNECG